MIRLLIVKTTSDTHQRKGRERQNNRKDTVLCYNDIVLSFFSLGDSGPPGPPGPPGLMPSGVKIDKSKKNKKQILLYIKYIYIKLTFN